jgi:flagellar basal-body rod modification protein FlgD
MMNKEVSWADEVTGQQDTGIVKGIIKKGNEIYYQVNDQEIPVTIITSAKDLSTQS